MAVNENVSEANAAGLVEQVDLIVDCAPLFSERFAMNRQAVEQGKPIVECAMYDLEAQLTSIVPGETPCLACLHPTDPPAWKREFPVFGAVSGTIGCLGAMEAIKLLGGFGEPLTGRMLTCDLRDMSFRVRSISRNVECAVCATITPYQVSHDAESSERVYGVGTVSTRSSTSFNNTSCVVWMSTGVRPAVPLIDS